MRLTWERFETGEPYPRCGRPYRGQRVRLTGFERALLERLARGPAQVDDPELPERRFTAAALTNGLFVERAGQLSLTESGARALAEHREDDAFITADPCRSLDDRSGSRFTVGDGPVHCSGHCPLPSLSPWQVEQLVALLRQSTSEAPREASEAPREASRGTSRAGPAISGKGHGTQRPTSTR